MLSNWLDEGIPGLPASFRDTSFFGINHNVTGLIAVIARCPRLRRGRLTRRRQSDGLLQRCPSPMCASPALPWASSGAGRAGIKQTEFLTWVTSGHGRFRHPCRTGHRLGSSSSGLSSDTVIGVFFAGAIGFRGHHLRFVSQKYRFYFRPENFLFGSASNVSSADISICSRLTVVTGSSWRRCTTSSSWPVSTPAWPCRAERPVRLCNAAFIVLLALVVNLCLRNVRAVAISALAIPASIIATFSLMRAMDFTLNNMTLLALTLAVGIVIDDAIVVLENIFRYVEEKRRTPFDAAIEGTRRGGAAGDGHHAFADRGLPAGGVHDRYARRFIYPFGWTMAFAIFVSMIVSFTLTPMLSSRWLKISTRTASPTQSTTGCSMRSTKGTRRRSDGRSLIRWRSSASPPALIVLTYPLNRMIGRTFVPGEDMAEFTVHADTPQGTSIEGTTEIAQSVVREIGEQEGVSHVTYLAGADRYTHFHVYFYLLPVTERTVTQDEVTARVRKILARHPAYSASLQARNPLGTGGNTPFRRSCSARISASSTNIRSRFSEGAGDAEPCRREDRLQRCQPRGPGRSGSCARRRPRRAHGDRSATHCA